MIDTKNYGLLVGLVILVGLARPAMAFGAGNIASISKVEGQNWRHGDIEDALLTLTMAQAFKGKRFNKMMVSRVYFGNWLRDYSQAVDVGTVKSVSAEAIRLLLSVLGFLTFGYGSGEFEVTAERLGCYRPEDHIDNPKDYADNVDARQYDRRLRGPVDERVELSIDRETGLKNYIANERAGCMTSAQHVRRLFTGVIELGRRYNDRGDKVDMYEALRLMGTGLHCLEDYFAHSNYTELALIEMGERDVFPHVGRDTTIDLEGARGPVYPIVTGTFGGVDFLHSVVGEVSDKMTQNEVDELEGTLQQSQNGDTSLLRELLDKIPDGLFGNKNQSQRVDELQQNANSAQMQNMSVSPREPEEFTRYIGQVYEQVMPAMEFHDDIMKSITEAVEKIPVLPKLIEQLEDQLSVFVFSIIAPFVVPLIQQIKNELRTGSDEIVESSEKEQHIVFYEDRCNDPTHSMLAKDHFSNILNEVAGQTSAKMLHWVVPQLMEAVDNQDVDINRLCDRIIHGVMAHPAQRDMGHDGAREGRQLCFGAVEEWWRSMGDDQRDDYRRKLSRDGVKSGENHKEGVYDTGHGHGCCGKLKMRKLYGEPQGLEDKIAGAAADAIFSGATGAISGIVEDSTGFKLPSGEGHQEGGRNDEEEGGLGGFLGAAGSLLGGVLGNNSERQHEERREEDGGYRRTEVEYGRQGDRYGQAEHSEKRYPDGSGESEYRRYEQQDSGYGQSSSYRYEERTETQSYGQRYEQRNERREESYGEEGGYGRRQEGSFGGGREEQSYGGGYSGRQEESYGGGGYDRRQEESYGGGGGGYGRQQEDSYGGGRQEDNYGGGYGGRQEDSYGRREGEAEEYERQGRDEGRYEENEEYGRRQEGGYGGGYDGGGGGYGGRY